MAHTERAVQPGPLGLYTPAEDKSGDPGIIEFLIPGIHCAGCIGKIERAVIALPDVGSARINFTTKRLAVTSANADLDADVITSTVEKLGYDIQPAGTDADPIAVTNDPAGRELLLSLAVAGFAAGNVMLLSISIWSGASDATRDLFHWLSALIALPAIVYAGRPFFRSALNALRAGTVNMDVPISLAVLLAAGLSLHETMIGGAHAWFDAAITLLFFLLIGRVLDHAVRARARNSVAVLLAQTPRTARVIDKDGSARWIRLSELRSGMKIRVAAGEQAPADGKVSLGSSDLDSSLLDGESMPRSVTVGNAVFAGTTNLTAPLDIRVTASGNQTYLAEIVRLMEAAEQGKSTYVRIADRAARIYTPLVHILAAAALVGWWTIGGDFHQALLVAIAVLIITCPCALGIAVPVVQVVASGLLFRRGILVKDGTALERLAKVDTIVFDKTGTLTRGRPQLVETDEIEAPSLAIAAALADSSNHPLSRALSAAAAERNIKPAPLTEVREIPGAGVEAVHLDRKVRLGRRSWCAPQSAAADEESMEVVLAIAGRPDCTLWFQDELRPDAVETIKVLQTMGYDLHILSGDRQPIVRCLAAQLGITSWRAAQSPTDKANEITALRENEANVLVVGDGLNDGPALATGNVSMAPSTASDLGRTEADIVFTGQSLRVVADALRVGRASLRHVHQNFALAVAYNLISVPIALAGLATPLVAALAMSSSSITVTLNALRLRLIRLTAESNDV